MIYRNIYMDINKESVCEVETELLPDGEAFRVEKLEAGKCCSIKVPFHALQPGEYTIQAKFSYAQAEEAKVLTVKTEVGSTIEATLNLGVIMIAYTLTRLSLNFTLGDKETL
jgi:hypothetical protein